MATLVASGAPPELVFATVTEEVGRLLAVDFTILSRREPAGMQLSVGAWSNIDAEIPFPVGTRVRLGGRNVVSLVVESGRPARIDDYADASGSVAAAARDWRLRSAVGVPIGVEGRLWGVIAVASGRAAPMPPDTEGRLAAFTELVGTAVANAQAHLELRSYGEEQAALQRVATLVARAAPPEEVFAAVTDEVGHVLASEATLLSRYDSDSVATVVGTWNRKGTPPPIAVGGRVQLGGRDLHTLVFRTRRPTRIEDYGQASAVGVEMSRRHGVRSGVGVPISVEGRLWGVIGVTSTQEQPLPADTEARLAGFTELIGTALANAQARMELRKFAEEQAALRRVATQVARAAPAEEVFASVTAEVGLVLGAAITVLGRFDPDGTETVVGVWSSSGALPVAVGTPTRLGGRNVSTLVFQTGRPARIDDYADTSGPVGDYSRGVRIRASVGVPITVDGRLWGVMIAASREESPSADTEARLATFTELVATAIANADAQAALAASRARIVAASDASRRRIERDMNDGVQQRLVVLAHQIRAAQTFVPPGADELTAHLDALAAEIGDVLDELREIARGLNPPALAAGGLGPALRTLARRSVVPVCFDVRIDRRPPDQIELAAYYVIAETLTNVAKHAHASQADVRVQSGDGLLRVAVRDDGRGGADISGGSGLVGLRDRVEALGGRFAMHSPPGAGTEVQVVLPLAVPGEPWPSAHITGPPDHPLQSDASRSPG